ncbi:hypothetical protein I6M34_15755 [Shewanella algae]|uniref:primase-helicase zinc-binding domain-containing protein n=1 Tax=Shewanella algae TaxID=38313 RepID=UPI001AADC27B|nr:primase-helicase zinc-binding domain-containing protein [Shewanella algae]MBO2604544.1 hypothetical protein [Shewanella algae]
MAMTNNIFSAINTATGGHWLNVLNGLVISINDNKHQACPVCGGKDRFRFDDKDERGISLSQIAVTDRRWCVMPLA